jgi:predicted acyltransferase
MSTSITNDREPPPPPSSARLTSLDVFRGLTVAGMIVVNNPGEWARVYPPLRHAEWHGWTPTDLVFPAFLFIVGVAIPLALGKRQARGDADSAILAKIVRRSVIIFTLGLLLNWFPFEKSIGTLRIPGVLQRIALCYLAAALLYLKLSWRSLAVVMVGLLLGYWALMTLVPGYDLTRPGNLAARVDCTIMPGHTYKPDYDPEGLLSTLPAIGTTLLGVLAGVWLAQPRPIAERVCGLFAAGTVLLAVGASWGAVFPINKALWTSSFVLYCGGMSLLLLGLCAWLIEVEGTRRWAVPFLVFGANPIAAFVLSGLGARMLGLIKVAGPSGSPVALKTLIYQQGFISWADPTLASLLFALAYMGFWLAVMAILYKLGWFIRV